MDKELKMQEMNILCWARYYKNTHERFCISVEVLI